MAGCASTPEVGRSPGTAPTFATRAGARRGDVLSHVGGSLSAPESLGHLVHEAVAAAGFISDTPGQSDDSSPP